MQIKDFEDFEIWQEARHLPREIYTLSKAPKFFEKLWPKRPNTTCPVSIMSNIAQGFERGGNQEFVQFVTSRRFLR